MRIQLHYGVTETLRKNKAASEQTNKPKAKSQKPQLISWI